MSGEPRTPDETRPSETTMPNQTSLPPRYSETDLRTALDELALEAPPHEDVLRGLRRRTRQRSQRRLGWVIVGAAAALVAVLVLVVPIFRPDPSVAPAGPVSATPVPTQAGPTTGQGGSRTWAMVSTVTPPTGWQVTGRTIQVGSEFTTLKPTAGKDVETQCTVAMEDAGGVATPTTGSRTTLAGVAGYYQATEGDQNHSGSFRWPQARGAWASVDCVSVSEPKAMVGRLVAGFRLTAQQLRVPFGLAALPDGYEIKRVVTGEENAVDLGEVDQDPGIETISLFWVDQDATTVFDGTPQSERLGGNDVLVGNLANGAPAAICLIGRPAICAYALSADGTPSADLTARIRQLMTDLQPAVDRADEAGWPSAADLPR